MHTGTLLAILIGVSLHATGCAQQSPELSARDTVSSSTPLVVDSSGSPQIASDQTPVSPPPPNETAADVAARIVSRNQEILYATSEQIQELIAIDTTTDGRDELNSLIADRIAPLRAFISQQPPATTWYIVRPLTVTVEEQTESTAKVVVWSTTIFSRQAVADPEIWFWLTDISLVRKDGQWLVNSYTQRPGPVAAPGEDHWPTTAIDLDIQLDGHTIIAVTRATQ